MKTSFTFIVLLFLISVVSCHQENMDSNGPKTINLDEKSAQLIEADNTFGLEIFQKIRENSAEENIMISPLSISVALAMAYNGADNATKTEMEKTLKLFGLTPEEINASYKQLIEALQSVDEKVVFELANAIFYKNGFAVKPDFLNINGNNYDAEVSSLDFNSPSAVETINNWVATKTHDKILSIIDQLNPDDRMVLLNAVYFNGIWTTEFEKEGTKLHNFTKNNGESIEVPMMNKEDKLEYISNSLFKAVKLPYGKGQYNMIVMLPAEDKNSQNIIDALSADNLTKWENEFKTEDHVVVTMPRFKFSFETSLNEVLNEMGMQKAFSGQADFSKITDQEDLFISSVRHKSFIDVNENGTEAAAVTSITFTTTSAGPGDTVQKIYFTVDKPFVFAITEKDTGAILFMGEVQNPEYEI
ncbi:MAG TPA: serpin family protein [Draconibacterium sp.]|nr:serpin family protein [Draconibacterium sp.]